jgi:hypothetical protein
MMHLESMMIAAQEKEEEEELEEETRGHPTELKTYYLESNTGLPKVQETGPLRISTIDTSLQDIKVIRLGYKAHSAIFYLDSADPRFLLLYTNGIAKTTDPLFRLLVDSTTDNFDRIWLPTEVQDDISILSGNVFRGFALLFDDVFTPKTRDLPIGELTMNVSGVSSGRALHALTNDEALKRAICYSKIRVERGNGQMYVADEIKFNGRIITKAGQSIDDHVNLVEIVRKKYRGLIEGVERNSLGTKTVEGRTLVEGQAFELELSREIVNLDSFAERLLNSSKPFRLWGIVNNVSRDVRQVVGVDLHTGDPINLEITPTLIRAYLSRGGCGNSILRLYVNLQHGFDSEIRLNGERRVAAE